MAVTKYLSVIIPAYRNPEYLELCLRSLYEGLDPDAPEPEVIVIFDGYGDELRPVVQPWKDRDLHVIEFDENKGETVGHNTGVTLASHPIVMLVNSDNVFPNGWNVRVPNVSDFHVVTPNQIEPRPSIFPSFVCQPLGDTPSEFDLVKFWTFETIYRCDMPNSYMTLNGGTWPVLMTKKTYMAVGGIDANFPYTPFADWDFFMRLEMLSCAFARYHDLNFYHFANPNPTPEQLKVKQQKENASAEYFAWKWGVYPDRNVKTNARWTQPMRGIKRNA